MKRENFVWVMTFHSNCVRFLRRFIDRIGFDNSFTIYDSDDQRTLMKKIFKEYDINSKVYKERGITSPESRISWISDFNTSAFGP